MISDDDAAHYVGDASPLENSAGGRASDSDFRKKLQTPLFLG